MCRAGQPSGLKFRHARSDQPRLVDQLDVFCVVVLLHHNYSKVVAKKTRLGA